MNSGNYAINHRRWRGGMMILAAFLASVTSLSRAETPVEALTLNDFNQGAELVLQGGNAPFYRLTVPENVYLNSARADLQDIRVFDNTGHSVPLALTSAKQTSDETIRVRFIIYPLSQTRAQGSDDDRKIRLKADNGTELTIYNDNAGTLLRPATATYLLVPDNHQPLALPLREVSLTWPVQTGNMQAKATLYRSDDKQNWSPVARDIPLMDLTSGTDTLLAQQIMIPSSVSASERKAPYWLLSVTGDNGQTPPLITKAEGTGLQTVERRDVNRFVFEHSAESDGAVIYSLPNIQYLNRLDITIAQQNTVLPVRIEYRTETDGKWLPLANQVLFSLEDNGAESHNANIVLNDQPVRQLRLTAINSSWRDQPPKVTGIKYAQYLTFNAQGTAPYLLAWGAYNAEPVFMPLSQMLPENTLKNQAELPSATLSDQLRTLGGEDKLRPAPPAEPPFAWKTWLLWGVLVAGVTVLGLFAVRLLKEIKPSQM
ncbi:MAG: DUF3999 domain-containing protein [Morganella sp. (in: enterobacteria)]